MEALFTINYLSKIFPSYVKKNATEASCYKMFFFMEKFLSRCPPNFHTRFEYGPAFTHLFHSCYCTHFLLAIDENIVNAYTLILYQIELHYHLK